MFVAVVFKFCFIAPFDAYFFGFDGESAVYKGYLVIALLWITSYEDGVFAYVVVVAFVAFD